MFYAWVHIPTDCSYTVDQWFPTGVPRHIRVPQRGVRGAAEFGVTAFLLHKVPPNCHFNQLGVPPNNFKDLKGSANQKSLKNTAEDSPSTSKQNTVRLVDVFFVHFVMWCVCVLKPLLVQRCRCQSSTKKEMCVQEAILSHSLILIEIIHFQVILYFLFLFKTILFIGLPPGLLNIIVLWHSSPEALNLLHFFLVWGVFFQ